MWQAVHALGTLSVSVADGGMNLNVWLRTITSPISCAIFGMWQATHSFPADPALWCVCCSMVFVCGPFGAPAP